jgi:hypothetical protein
VPCTLLAILPGMHIHLPPLSLLLLLQCADPAHTSVVGPPPHALPSPTTACTFMCFCITLSILQWVTRWMAPSHPLPGPGMPAPPSICSSPPLAPITHTHTATSTVLSLFCQKAPLSVSPHLVLPQCWASWRVMSAPARLEAQAQPRAASAPPLLLLLQALPVLHLRPRQGPQRRQTCTMRCMSHAVIMVNYGML